MTARKRLSKALGVALVLVVAAGCATLQPVPRQPISAETERALTALRERWREFSGLRTLAEVTVQRATERQQLLAVVLARPPASVRFEALSPMGQPLLLATIHDGTLTAYDATTDEAYVGPATAQTTARILGLPFEPQDLVAVLAGHALPPADVRVAELLPPDTIGASLELAGEVNRRRIWLDLETGQVLQLELTGGRAEARIRYLRASNGEPRGFDLTAMVGLITASVRYQEPSFGNDLPDDRFAFAIPKTAKIQTIR